MTFDSPLRYPGGKTSLSKFLSRTIEVNGLSGCSYYEPFAGGAGAALSLLKSGIVTDLHLNDLDIGIVSFWRSVLYEPKRFIDAIFSTQLNLGEWRRQLEIRQLADPNRPFDLGFATFYLNRCNRSGIILGAAPIGGYSQSGNWKIGVRFYRETLARRVLDIGEYRERIHISQMDALDFLSTNLSIIAACPPSFVYLDPPYHVKGKRLYMNAYRDRDHQDLASFVQETQKLHWAMSYDDTDFVRELYSSCRLTSLSLNYSLQRKRRAHELFILPLGMSHPDEVTAEVA